MPGSTSLPSAGHDAPAAGPRRHAAQIRTRMLISTLAITALTIALAGIVLAERVGLNQEIHNLAELQAATDSADEMSLRVLQDTHVLSAYVAGHVEHLPEFEEHAAAFDVATGALQHAIDDGVLQEDEQELLDTIRTTHDGYIRAARALFAAVDAARARPTPEAAAAQSAALARTDALGAQLDEHGRTLSAQIAEDVEAHQAAIDQRNQLMIGVVLGLSLLVCAMIVLTHIGTGIALGRPLSELLEGIGRFTAGATEARVPVRDLDEIGSISAAFNTMASTIHEQRQSLVQLEVAELARAEAEDAQRAIAAQLDTIAAQQVQIQQMSVPVLPVTSSTLVLPLIGVVDASRLRTLQQEALRAVEQRSARFLILDVTGVPLIDGAVVDGLLRTVQATRLLGADVVLVGIRPEVAQSLVAYDGSLQDITTLSSLQSGIQYVLGREAQAARRARAA